MSATSTGYLASKPRYEILDGLRGVAAMIVVAFHLFETYSKGPAYQILNHGYLAVDFFFVLSGFVIGYAYDDRWNKMSLKGFFKRRLVRLHPMVIMGSVVGALFFYFGAGAFPMIADVAWWKVLLVCLLGCTMLPALPSWDIRGWGETNPLNGPAWTLLYEYIANILYALVIRHFPKFVLGLFVAAAAVLTLDLSLNLDLFGMLPADRATAYTVIGGWSVTPTQIYIGFSRLLYPFFAGLLLSRLGATIRMRGGFWWCSLLIAAALVMPHVGDVSTPWIDGGYQALVILLLFPLIVSIGAGSRVSGARSIAVCTFLGEISFPLYITHYPLVYMQMSWVASNPEASLGANIFVNVSTFLVAVGIAWACLKLYDLPVREWLKRHWLMSAKKSV